jgi:hypothetical protein
VVLEPALPVRRPPLDTLVYQTSTDPYPRRRETYYVHEGTGECPRQEIQDFVVTLQAEFYRHFYLTHREHSQKAWQGAVHQYIRAVMAKGLEPDGSVTRRAMRIFAPWSQRAVHGKVVAWSRKSCMASMPGKNF